MTAAGSLALRDVRLAYGDRAVLHGIDLDLRPGERVAIIGPNGAGKSTLLRCVAGVARERRGRVELGGTPLEDLDRASVARRISVVPAAAALPFSMPVRDVVALGRIPHQHPLLGPTETDRAAVAAAIERVGIGALAERDVRELSLGERQLVLLAVAVAQTTPVLVLDEPTVHLDLRHRVDAMRLLVELNERDGVTVIAVLHDLALAHAFFPRVVLLADGRVVADGPPSSSLSAERVRRVFGVDPALVPGLAAVGG